MRYTVALGSETADAISVMPRGRFSCARWTSMEKAREMRSNPQAMPYQVESGPVRMTETPIKPIFRDTRGESP